MTTASPGTDRCQQDQATKLTQSARDLSTQIVNLRRSQFNSQVTSRATSPLTPAFWQSLIRPTDEDLARLRDLRGEAADAVASAFSAEHRWLFLTSLVAAILVWTLVRRLLDAGIEVLTMTAGKESFRRGSIAASSMVWVPPPLAPVIAVRSESTSGILSKKSMERIAFQVCRPMML